MAPQLDKNQAQATDDAESKSFEALPEGLYLGTLMDVEVKQGGKGDYWSWRFSDLIAVEDDQQYPGSQWVNTSLTPEAAWKLKETFEAFNATSDTDTDELLGKQCWLVVSQRVIERGARMGEMGNNVDRLMPIGEGEATPDAEKATAGSK